MAKTSGIAQFSQGRSDVHKVPPDALFIKEGWNSRDEGPDLDAHIDMLAQSIAQIGVRKAFEVKLEDGKLWVIDGHCRYRAVKRAIEHYKAEIVSVPVISADRFANEADFILNQVISNSGKPLTSLEQARVFKKLLDMGWQQTNIASKTGLTNGRVSQILDLLTLPAPVQAMIAAGAVSASLAAQTVRAAETPQAATATLATAVQAATAENRSVKPADVGQVSGLKALMKEAFENSDIDNSNADEDVVHIDMPLADFEKVRQALGL